MLSFCISAFTLKELPKNKKAIQKVIINGFIFLNLITMICKFSGFRAYCALKLLKYQTNNTISQKLGSTFA
jgi:hypothetical protein